VLARDSRKMFRLFKSINEAHTIRDKILKDLVWQPNKTPVIFEILSRFGFFFYWIFDNLQILSSIKFINGNPASLLKSASLCWFIAIIFGLAKNIYDLLELLKEKSKVVDITSGEKSNPKLDFMILKTLIDIVGKIGDLIVASNGIELPHKILGKGFNDGIIGLGGLIASLVSLWNIYLK
jgi:hypothetical protein